MMFDDKTILITGGTGSFGKAFTRHLLENHHPAAVRIFSRDEFKQHLMAREFGDNRLRFFIGDVRDQERVRRAMAGVDIVIHAAAMKQVPACEYNPFEAVKTNINGAQNIIEAAIDCGVEKVMAISTDKAVIPANLYGATKLCAEKIFIHGNSYAGPGHTRFSCVRYGNVIGSRGSVVPLFLEQKKTGRITVTDKRMSRFWITLDEAVALVCDGLELMRGREIFIPRIPSMKVVDMARAIGPECEITYTGIRPGEKLHEDLISEEEATHTLAAEDMFIILSAGHDADQMDYPGTARLSEGFSYRSDTNGTWLEAAELLDIIHGALKLAI